MWVVAVAWIQLFAAFPQPLFQPFLAWSFLERQPFRHLEFLSLSQRVVALWLFRWFVLLSPFLSVSSTPVSFVFVPAFAIASATDEKLVVVGESGDSTFLKNMKIIWWCKFEYKSNSFLLVSKFLPYFFIFTDN
jgi:hypothetical protein